MNSGERTTKIRQSRWNLLSIIMSFRDSFRKWNFVRTNLLEMVNFSEPIIDHKIGAILFKNFIKKGKPYFYIEMMEMWSGYKLCKDIIKNLNLLDEQETRDNLFLLRPTFLWEDRILIEIADFEVNRNEQKAIEFFQQMAKEFTYQMKVDIFYQNLMFEITFNRRKIQKDMEDLYEELKQQISMV